MSLPFLAERGAGGRPSGWRSWALAGRSVARRSTSSSGWARRSGSWPWPPVTRPSLLEEQARQLRPLAVAARRPGCRRPARPAGRHGSSEGPMPSSGSRPATTSTSWSSAPAGSSASRPVLAALRAGQGRGDGQQGDARRRRPPGDAARPRRAAAVAPRSPAIRSPVRSPGSGRSTPSTRRSGSAWPARRSRASRGSSSPARAGRSSRRTRPSSRPSRRTRPCATRPGRWGRRSRSTRPPSRTRAWR